MSPCVSYVESIICPHLTAILFSNKYGIPNCFVLICSKCTSQGNQINNLAKLGNGLNESPTVMVGEAKKNQKISKNT